MRNEPARAAGAFLVHDVWRQQRHRDGSVSTAEEEEEEEEEEEK
jgi:hypothetical protein